MSPNRSRFLLPSFPSFPSLLSSLLAVLSLAVPASVALAQEITLGASVQLTGPVANTGRYYRDAYEFAIEKINAAGGVKIGGQSRSLLREAGTHLSVERRIFVLRFVKVAEHPSDLMKFFWNGVGLVFRCFREFQNSVFPDFRKLRCTKRGQLIAEFFDSAETLSDGRIEREDGTDNVDRDRFGGCIVGLSVKKQTVPEMMRILRLIKTTARCFGDHEISWVIDGDCVEFRANAFWYDVVAIVGFAPSACWPAPCGTDFCHRRWWAT